jgi:hypothetical protein
MRKGETFSMRLALVGCLTGSLMAASTEEAASQPNFQDSPIRNFSGVEEIVEACTNSDSTAGFVDMPGMTRDFTLGGSTSEEVVVMFHATANLALASGQSQDTGVVALLIDGATQTPVNEVGFISAEGSTAFEAAHSFTWQSPSLTPGRHTALIQYRTDLGSDFCVYARSLIILHR